MAKSTLIIALLFFSLQLMITSRARSLSASEPKTTIHKPDSDDNTNPKSNDTGSNLRLATVPFTKVNFRHIGHIRFPMHDRLRCSHGFDRLMPVVRSRLGQRLFDDDVILLHERHGGFSRGSRGWNKIEGRQPFRVYFGKPSFEVWRNGMMLKKPYAEVVDDRSRLYRRHHDNEKEVVIKRDEGVLMKIRKFLTQF